MTTADIVRMANQIADYFKAYPHDIAVKETCNHFEKFWERRMRTQLLEHLAKGGEGLDPLALEAARDLQAKAG